MTQPASAQLRIGAWRVDPLAGQISRGAEVVRLEARTMRLLLCLAERAGAVVSIDELLDQAWTGVIVTPDSVYQGITALRRHLGDDPKEPTYIATVPRLGYRLVAPVAPWTDPPAGTAPPIAPTASATTPGPGPKAGGSRSRYVAAILLAIIGLCIGGAYVLGSGTASRQAAATPPAIARRSIAVLPFDMTTQEMNEEYFADGMTEELIGDLSKIAGLRVPAPTASFYYKGKQLAVADIARQLGVTYVLDGSVRKSGNVYRVAMRLVQADTGYVVYSESYDRALGDCVTVQKDIAAQATSAIRTVIDGTAPGPS